ncbi:hypothetical protein NMG60_11032404, partial [Bertholletia excelsa]
WPPLRKEDEVLPPLYKRHPSKPKKNKKRVAYEVTKSSKVTKKGVVMTCSNCEESIHNKRICKMSPQMGVARGGVAGTGKGEERGEALEELRGGRGIGIREGARIKTRYAPKG